MAQAETLQGLHLMLVHNPEQAIQRVHGMQGERPRWHKIIVHGEKADWLNRMPPGTCWDIRNVDISEEPLTAANAERLGREHAEVHARTLRNYAARLEGDCLQLTVDLIDGGAAPDARVLSDTLGVAVSVECAPLPPGRTPGKRRMGYA